MTITDDGLVRELGALADASLPPMSVDATAVLAAGRRRRRRADVTRAVGLLSVVALAGLGVARLVGTDGAAPAAPVTPPAAEVTGVGDLAVTAAAGSSPVDTALGTMHDVGVGLGPGDADVVRVVVEGDETQLRVRLAVPATGEVGEPQLTLTRNPDVTRSPALPETQVLASTGLAMAVGFVDAESQPMLHVAGRDAPIPLPTFAVPGVVDGARVFLVAVTSEAPVESWPDVGVSSGGGPQQLLPVGSHAGTAEIAVDDPATAGTLEIRVADDVQTVDSSAGAVLDLGIPVLTPFARELAGGEPEPLTYALRLSTLDEAAGDGGLSPADAAADAIIVAARAPHGALSPVTVVSLSLLHGVSPGTAPFLPSLYGAGDAEVLAVRPTGTTALRLVVDGPGGAQVVELPAFTIPGVAGEFSFVALHDPAGDVTAGVRLEVEQDDGTATRWSLRGERLD